MVVCTLLSPTVYAIRLPARIWGIVIFWPHQHLPVDRGTGDPGKLLLEYRYRYVGQCTAVQRIQPVSPLPSRRFPPCLSFPHAGQILRLIPIFLRPVA